MLLGSRRVLKTALPRALFLHLPLPFFVVSYLGSPSLPQTQLNELLSKEKHPAREKRREKKGLKSKQKTTPKSVEHTIMSSKRRKHKI
jgi:hypothetical protein